MLISEAIIDVRTGLETEVQDGLEMVFLSPNAPTLFLP